MSSSFRPCGTVSRGFTLMEVLVVAAIMALLLSILVPSLARAREQARTVLCATNLRTCGQGIAMYLQANRETYMHSNWAALIHKYVWKEGITTEVPWSRMNSPSTLMAIASSPFYLCPGDAVYHMSSAAWVKVGSTERHVQYPQSYSINNSLLFRESAVYPPNSPYGSGPNFLDRFLADGCDTSVDRDSWTLSVPHWTQFHEIRTKRPDNIIDYIRTGTRTAGSVRRQSSIVLLFDSGDDDAEGPSDWDFSTRRHDVCNLQVHHRAGGNFLYADSRVAYCRAVNVRPAHATSITYGQPGEMHGIPPYPWCWAPLQFNASALSPRFRLKQFPLMPLTLNGVPGCVRRNRVPEDSQGALPARAREKV